MANTFKAKKNKIELFKAVYFILVLFQDRKGEDGLLKDGIYVH